jgi:hypothetical protein
MPEHQLEKEGFSIVALGNFNPTIFQPRWFAAHSLIREEEADAAKIEIIHRDAAIFNAGWISLQVTEGNFTLLTHDPTKSLPLRDLVVGTFKLLEHTPLTAFGFNRFGHCKASSEQSWHAFGHHYAPKESWLAVLKNPGLLKLELEGNRDGCYDRVQIRIEASPANLVVMGIMIAVNQHRDLTKNSQGGETTAQERNKAFLSGVQNDWVSFLTYAKEARNHLLTSGFDPNTKPAKKRKN